ncbi:MAG: phage tail protein [Sphingobium sp.]
MKKPDSLRQFLTAALPELARNPDAIEIFVTGGTVATRMGPNLGFELRYTLHIVLLNFRYEPGQLFLPLTLWLRANQPELLLNHQSGVEQIRFSVDVIDNQAVDIEVDIPLTEAIDVLPSGAGYQMTFRSEPPIPGTEGLTEPLALLRQIWGKSAGTEHFIVGHEDE